MDRDPANHSSRSPIASNRTELHTTEIRTLKSPTMCLAIPGKITSIDTQLDATFRLATVNFGGIVKAVNLTMVPEAKIGDYVLVHVGVAISIVDEEEARKTFSYLKQMGEVDELGEGG